MAPIVDGKPRTGDDLEVMLAEGNIAREEFERLDGLRRQLSEELDEVLKHARDSERLLGEAMKALAYGFAAEIVNPRIDDLKKRYPGERPERFLEQVRHHVLENLDEFATKAEPSGQAAGLVALIGSARDPRLKFRVNLLVDNSMTERAPIVVETHPTYKNLFGTIERSWIGAARPTPISRESRRGVCCTRPADIWCSRSPRSSPSPASIIPSSARSRAARSTFEGLRSHVSLHRDRAQARAHRPGLKVVLIAENHSYQIFYQYDPDFRKVFKVKADFDTVMERNENSIARYALVRRECRNRSGSFLSIAPRPPRSWKKG